ncbi:MAG TPA: MBL fold metallo-hydrolase [Tepiditoga sp.]|nr:MBL fold metallo-hydrolase [Thermotogota bacterium]HOO73842.1 MBL fold metallo-hydrolase [Tepiditoga sp.]
MDKLTITGIVDNYRCDTSYKRDWGFSALIRTKYNSILFDTGNNPEILENNLKIAAPDLSSIDYVFISHDDYDHTGGIEYIAKNYSVGKFIIPNLENKSLYNRITDCKKDVMEITSPTSFDMDIHSTGVMGDNKKEQSLIINTRLGNILIAGCSHMGAGTLANYVKDAFTDDIYLFIGGYHFYKLYDDVLEEKIEEIIAAEPEFLAPTHCSGEQTREYIKNRYENKYFEFGAGKIFEI